MGLVYLSYLGAIKKTGVLRRNLGKLNCEALGEFPPRRRGHCLLSLICPIAGQEELEVILSRTNLEEISNVG